MEDALGAVLPAAGAHDLSMLGLFLQADPIVKGVMLLLAAGRREWRDRMDAKESRADALFRRKRAFSWHQGQLLPGTRLQTSYLKDLVTPVDPTSRHSFSPISSRRGVPACRAAGREPGRVRGLFRLGGKARGGPAL